MKLIKHSICLAVTVLSLSSCTLFGLDLLESETFEGKKADNEINMSVWDFIQSRPDIFSVLIDGIKYAEIENLYHEAGNTHILLTNSALSDNDNSFWNRNKITIPGKSEPVKGTVWEQYDKTVVKELLTYHILKGEWSYHNISSVANWVNTYGDGKFTYVKNGETLQGDTAVMDIKAGHDRNLPLQLNNYEWNFRGLLAASSGSCRSTNLKATNGYIHVSDWYQPRPERNFMGME